MTPSLDARFADAMGALLGPDFPSEIGLAVSGGGDSMAMLYLAHNWTRVWGVKLHVITVNHNLRPEAASEAAMVAEDCASFGWPHATVHWHWDGQGNLQDAARRGRLEAIDRWRGTLTDVLMAHTRDDLAETFLMRLARGSGVDGLSAMQASRVVRTKANKGLEKKDYLGTLPPQFTRQKGAWVRPGQFRILRPCLDMGRAELRHYLSTLKGRWVDDPSNDDPTFDRIKFRQAKALLDDLGLEVEALAATAQRMSRARDALTARAVQVWRDIGQEGRIRQAPTGEILFDRNGFEGIERDTQLRLLAASLQYVATAEYRPRAAPLDALLDRLLGGGGGTLHGCEARMERDAVRVFREYNKIKSLVVEPNADGRIGLWDNRWQLSGARPEVYQMRALGEEGWRQIGDPPEGAPPFHAARSLPSVWQGDRLISCPVLGFGQGFARLWPMGRELFSFTNFLQAH